MKDLGRIESALTDLRVIGATLTTAVLASAHWPGASIECNSVFQRDVQREFGINLQCKRTALRHIISG